VPEASNKAMTQSSSAYRARTVGTSSDASRALNGSSTRSRNSWRLAYRRDAGLLPMIVQVASSASRA
jgi:hypothetical protein